MTNIDERGYTPEILMIEDNRGDALLMRLAFKTARFPANVTVAPTAEAVLGALMQKEGYPGYPRPDLILLDLNLPKMQGVTLLNQIKGDPKLAAIPVIVFSSSRAEKDISECYANHANSYISKPLSLGDYGQLVDGIGSYWFNQVHTPWPAKSAGKDAVLV